MNKLDFLRARKAAVTALNVQAEQAADAIAAKLANRELIPNEPAPTGTLDKLAFRQKIANTALGMEMRELPYATEVDRIVNMPVILPMDKNEFEEFCRQNMLAEAYDNGKRFFDVQAEGISAWLMYDGAFCPVGVGFGKTLMSLAIAAIAHSQKDHKRGLLLVPPQVLGQLVETDIKWARSMIPMGMPIHILGGRDSATRRAMCKRKNKGLYIMPYSFLSVRDTTEMLFDMDPSYIICDEAHNLANRQAARTKRLMDFVEKRKPKGVMLSGTITSKSVRDYFHLIKWALGDFNPLPNTISLANEWATVIDAQATGTYGENTGETKGASGPLLPLIRWAQRQFPDERWTENIPGFRAAYKKRLTTAPGVVSSGDATIGTSLIIANRPVTNPEASPGFVEMERHVKKIEDEWVTPNGDEIEHAIHKWKWLYELSSGFYNELSWPTPEKFADRRRISMEQAKEVLERSQEYHRAGQVYSSALRKWLEKNHKPGIDTPFLVGGDMAKHGSKNVGNDLYKLWADHKGLDFEGRIERDSRAIRVCSYKVDMAVLWAKGEMPNGDGLPKGEGGIIWVFHQAVGEWVFDCLVAAGVDAIHCPAGADYNTKILDPQNAKKVVVASIKAHGTGKNLQHFQHNYFMQWPRASVEAEQTIGRTHRNGQKADELIMWTNLTNEFDQLNFAACLNDSLYIHQTTGNRQKLIYATYDPTPKIFPSAVLRERGDKHVRILTREQQQALNERFAK